MKILSLLILCLIISSCNGQKHSSSESGDVGTALLSGKTVRSIVQDRKGNYWFGTDKHGLYRYDGKAITHLSAKDGLPSEQIRTLQEDKEGNIWMDVADGIVLYDGTTFKNYTDNDGIRKVSYSQDVRNEATDTLWFHGREGTYHYNGKRLSFLELPLDDANRKIKKVNPRLNSSDYSIYSILTDKDGNVWFGTQQKGVFRYHGSSFDSVKFEDDGFVVRALYQDSKGVYWFGSNGTGLIRYDGKSIRNITNELGLQNPGYIKEKILSSSPGSLGRVFAINEDNEGNILIGTIDAGLWSYNGKSITNFSTKDGLTGSSVHVIYKDHNGTLWVGTSNGVCIFDGKRFTTLK